VQILAAMTAARDIYTYVIPNEMICDLYSTACSTGRGDGIAEIVGVVIKGYGQSLGCSSPLCMQSRYFIQFLN